jgi:hypothetical protein
VTEKKHVKVGPPVDEREDDGRKHDHLGPNEHKHVHELEGRAKFLTDNPIEAKVVEPAEQSKPKGSSAAQTK